MKETTTGNAKTSNIGGFNVGLSATNFYVDNKLIYGIEMIGSTTSTNITEIRNGKPTTIPNTNYSTELGSLWTL